MEANYGIATGAYLDERDEWPASIARARREGWRSIELTAVGPHGAQNFEEIARLDQELLHPFERVSVHAPTHSVSPARIATIELEFDLVLHPDVYGEAQDLLALGPRAVFENMDIAKSFGRTTEDMVLVFQRFPHAGFCLDVSHVWTNDPSLALGHDLLDALGGRLRQVHVSGIEPDGTHRETTHADLELYAPLLERCRNVPWLLETVLQPAPGLAPT